jgi:hypothetical protein
MGNEFDKKIEKFRVFRSKIGYCTRLFYDTVPQEVYDRTILTQKVKKY